MEPGGAAWPRSHDPQGHKSHKAPSAAGHQSHLPVPKSIASGTHQTVTAPKLKMAEVTGRALVIHEAGDNYSNTPENGGAKARIACGVVPKG